jgi:hypothetical protein
VVLAVLTAAAVAVAVVAPFQLPSAVHVERRCPTRVAMAEGSAERATHRLCPRHACPDSPPSTAPYFEVASVDHGCSEVRTAVVVAETVVGAATMTGAGVGREWTGQRVPALDGHRPVQQHRSTAVA